MDKQFYVYILASRSRALYVGVTNNLPRRMAQHQRKTMPGFTAKYRIYRLIHVEPFADVRYAIAREKQLKSWRREKKVTLIECSNPTRSDLSDSSEFKALQKQIPLAKVRPSG